MSESNQALANHNGSAPNNEPKAGADAKPERSSERKPRWPWFVVGAIVIVFVVVVLIAIFMPRANVWTDDADITAHYATVAPRISGQIATVDVDDNQRVKAGQVLATLDPRDNQTAVDVAEATLEQDSAKVSDTAANVARQPSLIEQQQAAVASAEAGLVFAQADARRFSNLASAGAGTVQQHQQSVMNVKQASAQLASATAALEATRRQMTVLEAEQSAAQGALRADRARLAQAQLDLSYTRIVAPIEGVVGERSVQIGNYVGPGDVLMTVVPLDDVYIEANYRESDLRHVLPGQHVSVHVDAYNIDLDGVVQSVPPASGAAFAPIAPSDATGNFTKIVQRLPVKITVTPGQPLARLLRVGFSVETTIHTGLANVVGEQRSTDAPLLGN